MAREGACTFTKMSYPVRRRFFFRFPCTLVADLTRPSTLQPDDVTQENFGDLGYTGLRVAEGVQAFSGWALGVYHFFRDEPVNVTSGIVAPERLVEAGAIRTALTIFLVSAAPYSSFFRSRSLKEAAVQNGLGSIMHVVNELGAATTPEGEEGAHTAYGSLL